MKRVNNEANTSAKKIKVEIDNETETQVEAQIQPTELDIYTQLEEYLGAEDPNAIEEIHEHLDPCNEIVMRAFFCSFNRRDTVTLKALLKAGADINTSSLREEDTVGDVNPLPLPPLYTEEGKLNESLLRNGPTALISAIAEYDIEYAKLLIDLGADVNAEYTVNKDLKSALWCALDIDLCQQTDKLQFFMTELLLKNGADASAELWRIFECGENIAGEEFLLANGASFDLSDQEDLYAEWEISGDKPSEAMSASFYVDSLLGVGGSVDDIYDLQNLTNATKQVLIERIFHNWMNKKVKLDYAEFKQVLDTHLPEMAKEILNKINDIYLEFMTIEAGVMHCVNNEITAMSLYDIISEEDLEHEALDIEALEFYCKVYPSCAELIQKYSASNSDANVVFTEQDRQKLLVNLQQEAATYLNSLHIQDVAMLLSSNEGLYADINQLIKNDQYKLISSSFKDYVSQCNNATHTEIETLMDLLQADGLDVPDHREIEIDITGEDVEYIL